jgi:histidinol-phosphate phosphatase family protein
LLGPLPKPMISIAGKPLIERQVELACHHGFKDILVFSCYASEVIERHLGAGEPWGARIRYLVEKTPLGTAGAVLQGFDRLDDEFLVLYGDTMVNADLTRFSERHRAGGADATLFLHPNDHPLDSDLVEVDSSSRITAFHNRPHPTGSFYQNLVNAGLYVIRKRALEPWKNNTGPLDFGKDLFPAMLKNGLVLAGYSSPEYIKDIGTPDRYARVCAEFIAGVVRMGSLEEKQRAVFIDRDGTLNEERDGVLRPEDLRLNAGVAEAIYRLNRQGIRAVVVTNQPVIAKGFCSEADVRRVHAKMETLLGQKHAFLDRIYYCPHHPEKGFPGERPELKIACECRKPGIGMILRARDELNIDLSQSWMIGDTTTDIETARRAGLKSILVRTGYAGWDRKYPVTPDFTFDRFGEAVDLIIVAQSATGRRQ